ncbi:hypothetical protein PG985_000794 [Apiospora marii]|uniref:uncharacterized protein n=1 Tax=Apiospora marii TaxID=335849 RepID=UPI00312E7447
MPGFSHRLLEKTQSLAPNHRHALDTATFVFVIGTIIVIFLLVRDGSAQRPRAASLGEVPDCRGQLLGRQLGPDQGGSQIPQGPGEGPPLTQARTERGPHLVKLHVIHQSIHQRRPFRVDLGALGLERRPLPLRLVPADALGTAGEPDVVVAHVFTQDLSREPHGGQAERQRGGEAVGARSKLGLIVDGEKLVELLLEGRLAQVLDAAMAGCEQGPAAVPQVDDGGGALPATSLNTPFGVGGGP